MRLKNYVHGDWVTSSGRATELYNAVTGEPGRRGEHRGHRFSRCAGVCAHGRRADASRHDLPPARSDAQGARAVSHGAQGTASTKCRRRRARRKATAGSILTAVSERSSRTPVVAGVSFPTRHSTSTAPMETISKGGTFVGRHVCVPLEGAAIQINAFNFPVWGMLEKMSTALLAGMPSIVKPATVTSYLTEAVAQAMVESGPSAGGSIPTAVWQCGRPARPRRLPGRRGVHRIGRDRATCSRPSRAMVEHSVRFNQEADSLNFSMLGPDATPGTEEFDLFIKEVVREMTVKAGQKCTAIRRTIVPASMVDAVIAALKKRLDGVTIGDPSHGRRADGTARRSHTSEGSRAEPRQAATRRRSRVRWFDTHARSWAPTPRVARSSRQCCSTTNIPSSRRRRTSVEAFGPVNTVMPYSTIDEAIALANLGRGSLVGSLFTADARVARTVALGTAPYHGRLMIVDRTSAKESTGHGSPLPHLVHGGPGRAGGGEEMGGVRGVLHYMQRTALQGSPTVHRGHHEGVDPQGGGAT